MAKLTTENWRNKNGTKDRNCKCGSWKQHWINYSGKSWPTFCSVKGCANFATLGAHVYNPDVSGEKIIPMCESCNKLSGAFSLKAVTVFVSANKSETCER